MNSLSYACPEMLEGEDGQPRPVLEGNEAESTGRTFTEDESHRASTPPPTYPPAGASEVLDQKSKAGSGPNKKSKHNDSPNGRKPETVHMTHVCKGGSHQWSMTNKCYEQKGCKMLPCEHGRCREKIGNANIDWEDMQCGKRSVLNLYRPCRRALEYPEPFPEDWTGYASKWTVGWRCSHCEAPLAAPQVEVSDSESSAKQVRYWICERCEVRNKDPEADESITAVTHCMVL